MGYLGSAYSWHVVLGELGIDVGDEVLPCRTECPSCHAQTLDTFHHTANDWEWHHCPTCRFAGTPLELAAQVWGISLPAAEHKLRLFGAGDLPQYDVGARLESFVNSEVGQTSAARRLLDTGRQALRLPEPAVRGVLRALGLHHGLNRTDWHARFGRFLSCAAGPQLQEQWNAEGFQRLIPGHRWSDCLLIPFQTLPGYTSGLWALGRDAAPKDQHFRTRFRYQDSSGPRDLGVCMLETLWSASPTWESTVFVFDSPLPALQLQSRHMSDEDLPLPVVGGCRRSQKSKGAELPVVHETGDLRRNFDRQYVVCTHKLTDFTVRLAKRLGARVAIDEQLATNTILKLNELPAQTLHRLAGAASSWEAALATKLESLSLQEAEELLLRAKLDLASTQGLLDTCRRDLRERLKPLVVQETARSVTFEGRRVVESDGCWSYAGRTICRPTFHLEKLLVDPINNKSYYQGTIYGKRAIPFVSPRQVVEGQRSRWLSDKLVAAGEGFAEVHPRWDKKLIELARAFRPPQTIQAAAIYGWHEPSQAFVLPNFIVSIGGQVTDNILFQQDRYAPARHLQPPSWDQPWLGRPLLDSNPTTGVIWSLVAAVASNILAPALRQRPAGWLLTGKGAQFMAEANAELLGCPKVKTVGRSLDTQARLQTWIDRHAWPFLVDEGNRSQRARLWLSSQAGTNFLYCTTPEYADLLQLRPGWNRLHYDRALLNSTPLKDALAEVLPRYLQDLATRRLRLDAEPGRALCLRVLEDLANWIRRQGYDPAVAQRAKKYWQLEPQPVVAAERFLELLWQLLYTRALPIESARPESLVDDSPNILRLALNDLLPERFYLSQEALQAASDRAAMPQLEADRVRELLSIAGVLLPNASPKLSGFTFNTNWYRLRRSRQASG